MRLGSRVQLVHQVSRARPVLRESRENKVQLEHVVMMALKVTAVNLELLELLDH